MTDIGSGQAIPGFGEISYEAFFSNAPIGIFVADEQGRYVFVNDAACTMTGYPRDELIGKNLMQFIYPDDREFAYRHFAQVKETGSAVGDCRYVTKSNEIRYWEVKAVRISDTCYIGYTSDITDKKRSEHEILRKNEELQATFEELSSTEEELKQQLEEILLAQAEIEEREQKYRLLFNTSEAGIALHEIICNDEDDPVDYRFLEINPAFEKMTGLSAKDIIGKRVTEVLPGVESYWIDTYGKVARTGKTVHFENFSHELGKYYEVTAYSPVKGQFATLIQDVTERKIQEIQLKETNSFLENLINHANVPIIVWDPSFTITRINHAFELLIGKAADEIVGKNLETLFPPDEAERSMRLIRTTLEGVRWETAEIPLLHKDGEIKTVLWNSATIYDPDGMTPRATIAQGRDITAERQLEREKDEAAAQIQENIAKLAILNDGIRNPLTIIATFTEMAADTQIADLILAEISRIDEMVNSLDREWIKSEKILNFLKKHDFEKTGFDISNYPDVFPDVSKKGEKPGFYPSGRYELFIEELQAQLYTILDSIDALIYVADMETYEILYLNKQGRYIFGNILGQKCYTYFQNNAEGPCQFCTNHLLVDEKGPTGVYRWEYYNTRTGRWFDCRDRAIRWTDGRLVRLEIATDITEKKHKEEALKEMTEELNRFWNGSLDLLCIADTDGFFRKLNPEWESALGYSLSELEGKRFLDFVHPDDLSSTQKAVSTLDSQEAILNFVNRYRHKDGSYRWIEWRSFPFGKYIYASARDISEYKRKEEEITRSEERFRTLVNAIQETMSVIDRDGTFIYANATAAKNLSGKDPSFVIGKNIRDFVSEEKAEELIHNYRTTIDTGIPFTGEVPVMMQGELKYFYNRLIPFRFSPDDEQAVLSLSLDITRQHAIREELTLREEQYRRIVDTAEEGIWQMDGQKNTVYVNPRMAEMLGFTPEEMLGKNVTSFMPPEELDHYTQRMIHRMHGENERYEQEFVKKDGTRIWLHVSATALVSADGTFNGSFAMFTDITEQKRAEKALVESETRFYELFNNLPVAVAIYRPVDNGNDFIFTDFNRAGEQIERIERADLIGRSVLDVFPGVREFGLFEVFQRVYQTGIPEKFPLSFYKDNRVEGWKENYVYKLPSGEIVAIYEDVTGRKQAEHELSVLSRSLSEAMKIAKMAAWEYDLKNGMFTFNDSFFAMFNMTAADAGGYQMSADEFATRYTVPAYADQVRETIQKATESSDPKFEMTIEGELLRPDASTFWVTTWLKTERDDSGKITRLFGVNQDITERKEMEIALARSEQEYRNLANSITDVFFAMDENLRYVFWNQASEDLTGILSENALGKSIYEIFQGADTERAAEVYKEVLHSKLPRTFENTYRLNEKEYIFEINVYPSGTGISVFTRDVTERKEMEKKLKDSTQKLLLLTQINRHDIFNELTAMHLMHDLALETGDLEEIYSLIRSSKEGLRRIEKVLQFTREYDNFASSQSMWLVLHRIIDSIREEVAAGDILFENSVPENIEVFTDPMIQKVFKALYENAIRHGQILKKVWFYTQEREGGLIIFCEDDGVGIPDLEKDVIFRYGHGKHTGIGLFLAREMLSVNGLSIRESGVETKGSRFEIHVPIGKWRYRRSHSDSPTDPDRREHIGE